MINFVEDGIPFLRPENQAECDQNNQALIDIYNALICLQGYQLSSKYCYNFQIVPEGISIFTIPKSDFPIRPSECDVNLYIIEDILAPIPDAMRLICKFDVNQSTEQYYTEDETLTHWQYIVSGNEVIDFVRIEAIKRETFQSIFNCENLLP